MSGEAAIGEEQRNAQLPQPVANLWPGSIGKTDGIHLPLQMLLRPLHLLRKALSLPQCQIVLRLPDNPDCPVRVGWIARAAKNVDLLRLSVPLLPRPLQHTYIPAELPLQHVVQHDIGDVLDITANSLAKATHLAGELL